MDAQLVLDNSIAATELGGAAPAGHSEVCGKSGLRG